MSRRDNLICTCRRIKRDESLPYLKECDICGMWYKQHERCAQKLFNIQNHYVKYSKEKHEKTLMYCNKCYKSSNFCPYCPRNHNCVQTSIKRKVCKHGHWGFVCNIRKVMKA